MKFQVNSIYSGFRLVEEKDIEELNGVSRLFYHEKSGVKLLNIQNDDENKVFTASFKTPPQNNKGIAHIMEHGVLCGSEKYPLKDVFAELAKGSLNTFINGGTYNDVTMYYAASTNDKDFLNLINVYMDLVFNPLIYSNSDIFKQQAWHYHIENKEDDIEYRGVVYNEMKGDISSPEELLLIKRNEALFPDTIYKYNAAGMPDHIVSLTEEEFLDFHRKYYHPSNSFLYLYGNGNTLEQLELIDEKYLKDINKKELNLVIPIQDAFDKPVEIVYEYAISTDESIEDKTFMDLSFVMGNVLDRELRLALEILQHMLIETSSSPLIQALASAEIANDISGEYDFYRQQPTLSIILNGSNIDKKEKFQQIVIETLKDMVKNGIDKKLIEASINVKEFELREAVYTYVPRGLVYGEMVQQSCLYGGEPTLNLEYEKVLIKVKVGLTTNYFEQIIEKYLLNNNHRALVVLIPSTTLGGRQDAELKEKLETYKQSLSKDKMEKLIDMNLQLKERQNTPNTAESLTKIPVLSLEDIDAKAEEFLIEEKEVNGIKVIFSPQKTKGISYINLLFDAHCVKQEDIAYVGFLANIMGNMSTEKYNYRDLSNEININTGGLSSCVKVYSNKDNCDLYEPKLEIKSKVLQNNIQKLMEIINQIINHSDFTELTRLKELILKTKASLENQINSDPIDLVQKRVGSFFSLSGVYEEMTMGIEFYKFICNLEENFDYTKHEISDKLKEVLGDIISRQNLIVSITTEKETYSKVISTISEFTKELKNKETKKQNYNFQYINKNEGLFTSSEVNYVVQGYNYKKLGYKGQGSLQVLNTILSKTYLWEKVRVQGGAYGAFTVFEKNGNVIFSSYRDPSITETLENYGKTAEFLMNLDVDDSEILKYIIGTIGSLDKPLIMEEKINRVIKNYLCGITVEDIQKEREEVLKTTKKDIQKSADLIVALMNQNCYCVIGNENKIRSTSGVFDAITNVIK